METLPVKSVVAPPSPASTLGTGAPTGDGTFSSTLGRALENMPGAIQDGASINPKDVPSSPHEKMSARKISPTASMAGIVLDGVIPSIAPPTPAAALSTEGQLSMATVQATAVDSNAGSPPDFASSLNTSADKAGTIPGTVALSGAFPALTGQGTMPMGASWKSPGAITAGIIKSDFSRNKAHTPGQVTNQISGLSSAAGQNQLQDASTGWPLDTSILLPPAPSISGLSQPVKPQGEVAQSEFRKGQASIRLSEQESESPLDSPASPGSTDSWRPDARNFSAPSTTDPPALGEFPIQIGEFAAAVLQAISNSAMSPGQKDQATSATGADATNRSIPLAVTDRPELAEFSSQLARYPGAVVRATSNFPASMGQPDQATPAPNLAASDSSTPLFATGAQSLGGPLTPIGRIVAADLQAGPNTPVSASDIGERTLKSDLAASDRSPLPPATDHPELAEFSSLTRKSAGAEIDANDIGNTSKQPAVVDPRMALDMPTSGPAKGSADPTLTSASFKSENLVNKLPKGAIRIAQNSGNDTKDVAWQVVKEPEGASAPTPVSYSTNPLSFRPEDVNLPPVTPSTILPKDSTLETSGVQPSGAVHAISGPGARYTTLGDASTSGQGKSGRQSDAGPGDNSAGVKTFTSSLASNPAPDAAGNLVTAHVPGVAASRSITSTHQPPPSSNEAPTALSAWQNYDGGAGKIVRSAGITESANGAEMHVELRAGTLGSLEVHATVHEGSVGAEIHVQGQEAHSLLSAGLPSLERALGERSLRVENIAVYQDHAGGGMAGGEGQNHQSDSSPSPQRQVLPWDNPPQPHTGARSSSEGEESSDTAAGLSVRA